MPLVSVVIPVYNIAAHLRQCLDSVIHQTLKDVEIICVDDGSTDDSPTILLRYAAKDRRIRIITQKNAGPGTARNTGMDVARGTYLIFLDSDDWFEPDFLERMVNRAEETGADVTICQSEQFDTGTGEPLPSEWMLKTRFLPGTVFTPEEIAPYMFQFTYGWPWDKIYRMEFVREESLRYPPLRNSEDLVFVFQSVARAKKIAIVKQILIHHRMNRMSSVSNSRHLDPEVPYQALVLLRQGLEEKAIYPTYERSFLNWAMEFLIWNVANIGNETARREYFRKLKREWLPAMNFETHSPSYYQDRFAYCKYLLARYAPYLVFRAVLYLYKFFKQGR